MIEIIKCKKCNTKDVCVVEDNNIEYICNKCGFENISYSLDDLKYMAISSVYVSNAMSYIENIDCICDVEHLVCMRCELLDRLKAVKEDLIDMIE